MRNSIRLAVVAAIVIGATADGSSQQAPPTFRSGRDVLTLDAAIRDQDGHPITDIQPSDFLIKIDGQARRVVAATLFGREVSADTSPRTTLPGFARASTASPGKVIVFAVDRDSIEAGSERVLLESTASMLESLAPADAVGVVGLPVGGIEATRDHRAAADAIRRLTGTKPQSPWQHKISWEEAIAYDRRDTPTIARVIERECPGVIDPACGADIERQAREMLLLGRGQALTILTRLGDLFDRLQTIRAPKHVVLLSGGLPFDMDLLSRYTDLATKAAQAHVTVSIVHMDQPVSDISKTASSSSMVGGQDYAIGLATIASSTGGVFLQGVGRATGALARITSDINYFYQLGIEAQPSDADGKTHRVEVKVNRSGASVRAPSQIAAPGAMQSSTTNNVARALMQPTDVTELPLEVATYVTHAAEADKVRVLVSATLADATNIVPAEWGYVVLDGDGKVIDGAAEQIAQISSPWSATAKAVLSSGRYRLRTALIAVDGRVATLDLPLAVGLRAAGAVQASDLIIGTRAQGQLQPAARLPQGEPAVAMIELSSSEPLAGTGANIELTRLDSPQVALRTALELQTRAQDATIVIAEAPLDLSALAPGTYRASVVLEKGGKPFGRISRVVDVVVGSATDAAPMRPVAGRVRDANRPAPDPALDGVLERLGGYVENYGEKASIIVAVEHYNQRYQNAPLGEPSGRNLVAELALVKTSDAIGWVGFRDVVTVEGKPIRDRQDRLMALFRAGTPDLAEARRIADESARFNIGPTRRNFNDPTAALFFFLPRNHPRFAFTRKGTTKIDGVEVTEIDFRETSTPTLIRTAEGRDVASQGTLWIVPADGTVVRTLLIVSGFAGMGSTARIEATFGRNERLGMWVPVTMTERCEGRVRGSQDRFVRAASVTATATYGDFKRFEVSTSTTFKD